MEVRLLGLGCRKSILLQQRLEEAMNWTGVRMPVQYVSDVDEIMAYQIEGTPALLFGNKVISEKQVPSLFSLVRAHVQLPNIQAFKVRTDIKI